MKYLILSLAGLLTSGCAAFVMASTAVVLTEEFQNNAITVTIEEDAEMVWASAKSSLAHMTTAMIRTDEELKHAVTKIDGAQVSVEVQNWDTGETRLRVMAREYVIYDHVLAKTICDRIAKELLDASAH